MTQPRARKWKIEDALLSSDIFLKISFVLSFTLFIADAIWIQLQQIFCGLSMFSFSFSFQSRNFIYTWAGLRSVSKSVMHSISSGAKRAGRRTGISTSCLWCLKMPPNLLAVPCSQKHMNHVPVLISCKLPVDFIGHRTGPIKLKCGWSIQ